MVDNVIKEAKQLINEGEKTNKMQKDTQQMDQYKSNRDPLQSRMKR